MPSTQRSLLYEDCVFATRRRVSAVDSLQMQRAVIIRSTLHCAQAEIGPKHWSGGLRVLGYHRGDRIEGRVIMKLVSFTVSCRNSYGAVVGDGIVDLGRRLGDGHPTLRAAIAADALAGIAAEVNRSAPDI